MSVPSQSESNIDDYEEIKDDDDDELFENQYNKKKEENEGDR
jgi:hypothetical protein